MSFTENNHNGLIYMSSDKIGARHAFTTRYGGVSTGIFSSLNLGSNRGDDPEAVRENYRRVCELMGVGIDDMAVTQQVHKADVRIVTSADKHVCMSHVPYEADGIVTSERGLPIMCMVADCVPVLLYDGVHSAAGAIHCGWRSSVGDILKNALDAMASLGAKAQSVHAAIGPSIGRCCFETDDDVPQAIERYLSGAAPAARRWSTCARQTRGGSSSSGSCRRILIFRMNAPTAAMTNTGRTAIPTGSGAVRRR